MKLKKKYIVFRNEKQNNVFKYYNMINLWRLNSLKNMLKEIEYYNKYSLQRLKIKIRKTTNNVYYSVNLVER